MNNSNGGTFVKLGSIWRKKDDADKTFVRLGNTTAKNSQYNYTVELLVKDSTGKEVLRVENPILNIQAPFQSDKTPENLLGELSILKR